MLNKLFPSNLIVLVFVWPEASSNLARLIGETYRRPTALASHTTGAAADFDTWRARLQTLGENWPGLKM
jgi:hypothetical protein